MTGLMYDNFFKKYWLVFLAAMVLWVSVFSFSALTTKPRIWIDEAKSIELARNFFKFGKLDIQTAPGKFTGFPEILQSTGYPVTVPLALFFKSFGYGLVQARIFMLIWMIALLVVVFFVGRRLFGIIPALFAVLLTSTFASFYDSGRTVVGEIPGFLFLLAGLYLWLIRDSYFWSGVLLGFAVVTKPSVFTWIAPALILVFLLERKGFFSKVFKTMIGTMPAAIGWIVLVLDQPFAGKHWSNILNLYRSPYGAVSPWEDILRNLVNAPYSATLVYFGFLFGIIVLAYPLMRGERRRLYNFAIGYCVFALIYYLRSPGWLRYILIAELLILFLLPSAMEAAISRFKRFFPKMMPVSQIGLLLMFVLSTVQFAHLFTAADIFYSDSQIRASDWLNREFAQKSIGVLDDLPLSVLLHTNLRYQTAEMMGIPLIGENPLLLPDPPEVIVAYDDNKFLKEGEAVIKARYNLLKELGSYIIYIRI